MIPYHFKEKIAMREWANLKILDLLTRYCKENPDLRFRQILAILSLDEDGFYEESVDTLKNITDKIINK